MFSARRKLKQRRENENKNREVKIKPSANAGIRITYVNGCRFIQDQVSSALVENAIQLLVENHFRQSVPTKNEEDKQTASERKSVTKPPPKFAGRRQQ